MQFTDVIEQRYSVRKYKDQPIPEEDIRAIITAAGKAPSGKNNQNWHFVVIQNKEMLEAMAKAVEGKMEKIAGGLPQEKGEKFLKFSRFSTFFRNAPVVVAVYGNVYVPEGLAEVEASGMPEEDGQRMWYANPGVQSIGAGVENLILKAVDMGYGACWMTSANHSLKEMEEVIGFEKEGYHLMALVPMGVAEGERKSPAKHPVDEIMTIIR